MSLSSNKYKTAILRSGLSIYDSVEVGSKLWIPSLDLDRILNKGLKGESLAGLSPRTRSKVVKEKICGVLGYPVPKSFKKVQPRFSGQNFDTYVQKSNNLQIWNEELSPERRYVIIRVDEDDIISKVRVINGDQLAVLDTTGTLTQKYQARLNIKDHDVELISKNDTQLLKSIMTASGSQPTLNNPVEYPTSDSLLPISIIFKELSKIIGYSFKDLGAIQDRNRGGAIHEYVCEALGYKLHKDNGQFPDVLNQLLEVKLQTSPTIDLGLVSPDSKALLDLPQIKKKQIRHCDVRYAIFGAKIIKDKVCITNLFLSTGEDFFKRFPRFEGNITNKKIQIPLPKNFFN